MADENADEPRNDDKTDGADRSDSKSQAEFRVELRDSLPGDRALVGVEQEGEFMWLASRKYVHPKAVEEFVETLQKIVREGYWVQNWPGC
mgnify:CR=1 FL=1